MVRNTNHIKSAILDAVHGHDSKALNMLLEQGITIFPLLAEFLTKDLPIEELERFENILKAILRPQLSGAIQGDTARQLALFHKKIGLLFKYKSYTIKASTPLGYSIFIQNERQGFSYQRHVAHKTEIFHILEVKRDGYIFICDYKDWEQSYDKEAFLAWLLGHADDNYEKHRFYPSPGDVFVIDKLNVVHTVIGCVLEEFATASTDMVDRLYDQNKNKSIPDYFNHHYTRERLRTISTPNTNRRIVNRAGEQEITEISQIRIPGGLQTPLAQTSVISASHLLIEPYQSSELQFDKRLTATIYIWEGTGRVIIGDREEVKQLTPPTILVSTGDTLIIPAGIYYGFVNENDAPLKLSEHKVPSEIALYS